MSPPVPTEELSSSIFRCVVVLQQTVLQPALRIVIERDAIVSSIYWLSKSIDVKVENSTAEPQLSCSLPSRSNVCMFCDDNDGVNTPVLYCTVLYSCTVLLYCTVLYCTVLSSRSNVCMFCDDNDGVNTPHAEDRPGLSTQDWAQNIRNHTFPNFKYSESCKRI